MGIIRGQGKLIKWQDDKGYGFIRPNDGNQEIFLHISSLKNASRRPKVGDTIIYELVTEKNGKSRAAQASIQGVNPRTVSFQQKSIKSKPIKTIKAIIKPRYLFGILNKKFCTKSNNKSIKEPLK